MREQSKKLENIKKSSNVAMILARIAKICCIVGAAACLVTGIGLIAFQGTINKELLRAEAEGKLDLNEVITEFNANGMFEIPNGEISRFSQFLGMNLLVMSIFITLMAVLLHFVSRVFKEIKESDSPFRKAILKDMTVVFVLITLLVLQSSILTGVMVGFALWCVYSVFEYGCELQQMSDETL